MGWWPSFHIGWKKVTIRYCIPVLRYRAVRIYVLSCPSSQGGGGGGTPITSVTQGPTMTITEAQGIIQSHPSAFRYDAMGSLREQLNDKYHKAGLYIVGGVALCVIPGGAGAGLELVSQGFFLALTGEDPNIGMSPTAPKIVSP